MKFSRVALLSAASLAMAQPHAHNHAHQHAARHGNPVQGRDAATTTTVPGPVVTVYELNGEFLPWAEVQAGIEIGKYVLTGDKITAAVTPSSTPISSTPTPTPSPSSSSSSSSWSSSSSSVVAKFLEEKSSTTSTSTTPTSTYVPSTTSSTPAASSTPSPSYSASVASVASSSSSSSSSSSGTGLTADFPSGEIDCDDFASLENYGAVAADWLGLGGYTGIQIVPSYSLTDTVISYIETAISGQSCTANSFCSYACPAGYQKAQWPAAQGSTGQSVGGLLCNSDGKLELTRDGYSTLCQEGVGSVSAKNSIGKNVAFCRTDYPGTESETIGVDVAAGDSQPVTCPDSSTYYTWQGMSTTAQYYVNPSGYTKEEACLWGEAGSNIGNWAPLNMGLGMSTSGDTFMSLFPNTPTNPDGVLDFNVRITGDVSGECTYEDGQYYSNGVASPTGCTVGVTGAAVMEFY